MKSFKFQRNYCESDQESTESTSSRKHVSVFPKLVRVRSCINITPNTQHSEISQNGADFSKTKKFIMKVGKSKVQKTVVSRMEKLKLQNNQNNLQRR